MSVNPNLVVPVTVSDETRSLTFRGTVLAVGSSQRPTHLDHRGDYAAKRERCAACRWLEVTIYRREPTDAERDYAAVYSDGAVYEAPRVYVVYNVGRSIVPGEFDYPRITETDSPYEVVEALTVRRSSPNDDDETVFMPPQYARALAAAAQHDVGIRDAYVNRAVV